MNLEELRKLKPAEVLKIIIAGITYGVLAYIAKVLGILIFTFICL